MLPTKQLHAEKYADRFQASKGRGWWMCSQTAVNSLLIRLAIGNWWMMNDLLLTGRCQLAAPVAG